MIDRDDYRAILLLRVLSDAVLQDRDQSTHDWLTAVLILQHAQDHLLGYHARRSPRTADPIKVVRHDAR